jgi:hypothetical protein
VQHVNYIEEIGIRKELEIKAGLRLNGIRPADIARELNLSLVHVLRVMQGKSQSRRVEETIQRYARRVKIVDIEG